MMLPSITFSFGDHDHHDTKIKIKKQVVHECRSRCSRLADLMSHSLHTVHTSMQAWQTTSAPMHTALLCVDLTAAVSEQLSCHVQWFITLNLSKRLH